MEAKANEFNGEEQAFRIPHLPGWILTKVRSAVVTSPSYSAGSWPGPGCIVLGAADQIMFNPPQQQQQQTKSSTTNYCAQLPGYCWLPITRDYQDNYSSAVIRDPQF